MEITYLLNSGFLVRLDNILLVFDDFRDDLGTVAKEIERGFDALYIFASHAHFDHFDSHILQHKDFVTKYVFSNDIRRTSRAKAFPADKTVYLKKYDGWQDDCINVQSFDSTDVGTSFLVTVSGKKVFHAGDFNWWHWLGDTEENNKLARNGFMKQMQRLDGLEADVAFFPVDGRLGAAWDMGAKEFVARTKVKALVTMHNVGYPAWQPTEDFFVPGRNIPYWTPLATGDSVSFP